MEQVRIRFNRPSVVGNELAYVAKTMTSGHLSGDGHYTKLCHELLCELLGVPKVLLTTSCTHALEMAAMLLDIGPGDEVIVPSFTFVSTVNAFVIRGARPVFIDIRPDTLNLDERLLERLVTPRTKAIVPVHYAGVACEMDVINSIAAAHNISVVEDNAHGLFGLYRNKFLGTLGTFGTQSFHETKNFQCGEGGALLINDNRFAERAEIIREKGTNRAKFFRGQVDKYSWIDVGSSYLPSEILAAVLYGQLEMRQLIQQARKNIWQHYYDGLQEWAAEMGVTLPIVPHDRVQPYHMFYMLMPSLETRQALIEHLRDNGILAVYHYLPLHLSEMGIKYGGLPGDCPVTESVSDRLIRLPMYFDLSEQEQHEVINCTRAFSTKRRVPSLVSNVVESVHS